LGQPTSTEEATADVSAAGQDKSAEAMPLHSIAKGCVYGRGKRSTRWQWHEGLRAPAAARAGITGEAGRWRRSTMETRLRNTSEFECQQVLILHHGGTWFRIQSSCQRSTAPGLAFHTRASARVQVLGFRHACRLGAPAAGRATTGRRAGGGGLPGTAAPGQRSRARRPRGTAPPAAPAPAGMQLAVNLVRAFGLGCTQPNIQAACMYCFLAGHGAWVAAMFVGPVV